MVGKWILGKIKEVLGRFSDGMGWLDWILQSMLRLSVIAFYIHIHHDIHSYIHVHTYLHGCMVARILRVCNR